MRRLRDEKGGRRLGLKDPAILRVPLETESMVLNRNRCVTLCRSCS